MARVHNNFLTKGLSGMIGQQMVFRSWKGKTYLSIAPKKPTKQSAKQKENRSKFQMATGYAKRMMTDPVMKAEYKKIADKLKLPNAYTAAITEYMRKPEIYKLDLAKYTGKADEEIKVKASKNGFDIQEVEVVIIDKDGEVIEGGKATKGIVGDWTYRTKVQVEDKETTRYLVRIRERTGNIIERKF